MAAGGGVNADNIRQILRKLSGAGFDGVLSIECEGQGGPMLADSLDWLRAELTEAGFEERRGSTRRYGPLTMMGG